MFWITYVILIFIDLFFIYKLIKENAKELYPNKSEVTFDEAIEDIEPIVIFGVMMALTPFLNILLCALALIALLTRKLLNIKIKIK